MSTEKAAVTPKSVLSALAGTSSTITLAVEIAGELIPLGKALVQEIKQIATGAPTVTYSVLLQMDGTELEAIDTLSAGDLTAINAELVKLGLPAIAGPTPPATPPTQ
jgi:hypothetical protein